MMMMRAAVSSAAERLEKLLLDTESRERRKGNMDGVVEEVDTLNPLRRGLLPAAAAGGIGISKSTLKSCEFLHREEGDGEI